MKITDFGYAHNEWAGKQEVISLDLLKAFNVALGGNDGNMNLVLAPLTEDGQLNFARLRGTILSPAEYLVTAEGEVVPGLLFNGLVDFKQGIRVDGKNLFDIGLFFDLGVFATTLHFHVIGKKSIEEVKAAATVELRKRHEKYVINRHEGICIRAVAEYDPRMTRGRVAISIPMAEDLLVILKNKLGDNAPNNIQEISGMGGIDIRFPDASSTSLSGMRIQVINDYRLSLRYNDYRLKITKQGDCDGDQLMITFAEGYLNDSRTRKSYGALPILDPLEDPEEFLTPKFTMKDMKSHPWPDSVQTATGLMAKSLQGIVCNFFERLAATGIILDRNNRGIVDLRNRASRITGVIKDAGQGATTEVTLDYRKYVSDDDPKRFAQQLWNIIDVALGKEYQLDDSVRLIDKDGAKVNVDLINGILNSIEDSLAMFLDRYAIQGSLIGDLSGDNKVDILIRLAEEIAMSGVQNYLDCAAGFKIEAKSTSLMELPESPPSRKLRVLGWGKPCAPWFEGEDPWKYVARRAAWAGRPGNVQILPSSYGTRIQVGPVVINLDTIRFVATPPSCDGSTLGFIDLTLPGDTRRRARLILRSNNANFGMSDDLNDVSLVTILDVLAETLANSSYEAEMAMKDTTKVFNAKKFGDSVIATIDRLIESYSRLPGSTESGDRVQKEVNIDSLEASVILPKGAGPGATMELAKKLLTFIDGHSFSNPLEPRIRHCFDPGMTSKNKPGTVVSLLAPSVQRELPNGDKVAYEPTKPVMQYVVNGWVDTDRQMRESRTVRFSCSLMSEQKLWFKNGFEHLMPTLTKRRRDAVWVMVNGASDSWFFSDPSLNCDLGRLTPEGMKIYKRRSRPDVRGPISASTLEGTIEEIMGVGATINDMLDAGWKIEHSPRRLGRYNKETVYEEMYTLTGPESGEPTWHKIYLCGHKFVAVSTQRDYFVNIKGKMHPVAGFLPVESMIQKKMQGTIAAGLSVLLGKDFFGALAEGVIHEDRKEGDKYDKYNDIVKDCGKRLRSKRLPVSGHLPIVRDDGKEMGLAIAGVFPTYVLREDDKISTGVTANGCPRSVLVTRHLGERIVLPKGVQREILAVSRFIAHSIPTCEDVSLPIEDLIVAADSIEFDEPIELDYEAQYNAMCYDEEIPCE